MILDAVRAAHALHVIVLPNDPDTVLAAQAAASAARQEGIEVHVVRARSAVQGLAALAVADPSVPAPTNVSHMAEAAASTAAGAVSVAVRPARTAAGECRVGDVLGLVRGEITDVGDDLLSVAEQVASRLLASGGELVTVVLGEQAPAGLGEALTRRLCAARPGLEVQVLDGGQPLYPVLIGVE